MTASEMWNIVATVAICQLACDLLSNYLVFSGERYKRLVSSMERAKWKLDKAETDLQKNPKNAKRHQRAKEDYGNACSEVAKRHIAPSTWSSIFFFIILSLAFLKRWFLRTGRCCSMQSVTRPTPHLSRFVFPSGPLWGECACFFVVTVCSIFEDLLLLLFFPALRTIARPHVRR